MLVAGLAIPSYMPGSSWGIQQQYVCLSCGWADSRSYMTLPLL